MASAEKCLDNTPPNKIGTKRHDADGEATASGPNSNATDDMKTCAGGHGRGSDDTPNEAPKQVRGGMRKKSSEVAIRMIESHLGRRAPRVGMPEPPHPTSPGLHTRVVDMVTGSVSWVKASTKVQICFDRTDPWQTNVVIDDISINTR